MTRNAHQPMIDVIDLPIRWSDRHGVYWILSIHPDYDEEGCCGIAAMSESGRVLEMEHVAFTDLPPDALALMRERGWVDLPS